MKKDVYQKLAIVEKVIDKEVFESLYYSEPFLCKLVFEQFKSYFDDSDFDTIERQIMLLRFLKNNYPIELSRELIEYCNNSRFADEYTRVIMEWNYDCSDFIKQSNIAPFDVTMMAFDNVTKNEYDSMNKEINKNIDVAVEIARLFIQDKSDKENGE